MKPSPSLWTDQRVEVIIGNLLRFGVALSAALILTGGFVYLNEHGNAPPHYGVFRGEPAELRSAEGILRDAESWNGSGIIQLGILVLIATPVARVLFSVFAFAIQRDWLYVAVAVAVAVVLALSLSGV